MGKRRELGSPLGGAFLLAFLYLLSKSCFRSLPDVLRGGSLFVGPLKV